MVVEAKRPSPPVSRSGRSALVELRPDVFLELMETNPTEAFRLIFPDYPLDRTRTRNTGRGATTMGEDERKYEKASGVTQSAVSERVSRGASRSQLVYQQANQFDVKQSRGDSADSRHSHPTSYHTTSAFHTEFAQDEDDVTPREGRDEVDDEEVEDTRQLIHNLVIEAQHRNLSRIASRDHSVDESQSSLPVEEEIEEEVPDSPHLPERCEVAVSPPSSPSSRGGGEWSGGRKDLQVPPRDMSSSFSPSLSLLIQHCGFSACVACTDRRVIG